MAIRRNDNLPVVDGEAQYFSIQDGADSTIGAAVARMAQAIRYHIITNSDKSLDSLLEDARKLPATLDYLACMGNSRIGQLTVLASFQGAVADYINYKDAKEIQNAMARTT